MKVYIGSKNPNKIEAVREALSSYDFFREAEFSGCTVSVPYTEIPEQPCGLEEIFKGSAQRATSAWSGQGEYGVGIESGLIRVPSWKETLPRMNLNICTIYDGKHCYVGMGSGFLIPTRVAMLVQNEKLQLDAAWKKAGLTENERIGYAQGIIHGLTNGRMDRKEFMGQAVHMAATNFLNKDLFSQ